MGVGVQQLVIQNKLYKHGNLHSHSLESPVLSPSSLGFWPEDARYKWMSENVCVCALVCIMYGLYTENMCCTLTC